MLRQAGSLKRKRLIIPPQHLTASQRAGVAERLQTWFCNSCRGQDIEQIMLDGYAEASTGRYDREHRGDLRSRDRGQLEFRRIDSPFLLPVRGRYLMKMLPVQIRYERGQNQEAIEPGDTQRVDRSTEEALSGSRACD